MRLTAWNDDWEENDDEFYLDCMQCNSERVSDGHFRGKEILPQVGEKMDCQECGCRVEVVSFTTKSGSEKNHNRFGDIELKSI